MGFADQKGGPHIPSPICRARRVGGQLSQGTALRRAPGESGRELVVKIEGENRILHPFWKAGLGQREMTMRSRKKGAYITGGMHDVLCG